MFVNDIEVLCPYNNEKIMQIHDNRLIAEYMSYDFKEMLERKKVKSWLKSVSAFRHEDKPRHGHVIVKTHFHSFQYHFFYL